MAPHRLRAPLPWGPLLARIGDEHGPRTARLVEAFVNGDTAYTGDDPYGPHRPPPCPRHEHGALPTATLGAAWHQARPARDGQPQAAHTLADLLAIGNVLELSGRRSRRRRPPG